MPELGDVPVVEEYGGASSASSVTANKEDGSMPCTGCCTLEDGSTS